MLLFDPERVDPNKLSPHDSVESHYSYLSTSGRRPSAEVRTVLETWFALYPDEHKFELRRRIETSDADFNSEYFELLLHTWLLRIGAEVEIHPEVDPDVFKRPDFLVTLPCGNQFYLEGVVATGLSDDERSRERVENVLYAQINQKLRSLGFFISVCINNQGPANPKGNTVVYELHQFLKGLQIDEVRKSLASGGTKPVFTWQRDGWEIEFAAWPSKHGEKSPIERPIGIVAMAKPVICTNDADIRASVKHKIRHHSVLDRPYIIAVNAADGMARDEDLINATYGSEQVTVKMFQDGNLSTEPTRALDGIWIDKNGPKHDEVVAVIGALQLSPWSCSSRALRLLPNPYITSPNYLENLPLTRYIAEEGRLKLVEGPTLGDFLGLPGEWPADD